jgi:hypothetical protein
MPVPLIIAPGHSAGLVTGHTYVVYGPLCNGTTSVIFESLPNYPHPGRYPRSTPREYPEYPMSHVCTGTRRQVLGDGGAVEADAAVHGAHCAPASDEVGRQLGDAVRSVISPRARLGRRADQRRSVEVVRSAERLCVARAALPAARGAARRNPGCMWRVVVCTMHAACCTARELLGPLALEKVSRGDTAPPWGTAPEPCCASLHGRPYA